MLHRGIGHAKSCFQSFPRCSTSARDAASKDMNIGTISNTHQLQPANKGSYFLRLTVVAVLRKQGDQERVVEVWEKKK